MKYGIIYFITGEKLRVHFKDVLNFGSELLEETLKEFILKKKNLLEYCDDIECVSWNSFVNDTYYIRFKSDKHIPTLFEAFEGCSYVSTDLSKLL
jgi:hypothetical protein